MKYRAEARPFWEKPSCCRSCSPQVQRQQQRRQELEPNPKPEPGDRQPAAAVVAVVAAAKSGCVVKIVRRPELDKWRQLAFN